VNHQLLDGAYILQRVFLAKKYQACKERHQG
jgi:hypothetical protein